MDTGANQGIGFEIVRQLALLNHTVILTDRNELRGKEVTKKLEKEKLSVNFIKLDVTDPQKRNKANTKIEMDFKYLGILIDLKN